LHTPALTCVKSSIIGPGLARPYPFPGASRDECGELRLGYHAELRSRLVGEESKDMIGRSAAEIEALVGKAK